MGRKVQLVWFKRDLRTLDHAALAQAAARGLVLPLYIAEPGFWAQPTASARQWHFVAGALEALRADLARLGAPLVVRQGEAVAVLDALHRAHRLTALWSHEETGEAWSFARDRAVAAWARRHGLPWHQIQGAGVVRCLKGRDGWAGHWERQMATAETPAPRALPAHRLDPGAIPSAAGLSLAPDPAAPIATGTQAARETLASFLEYRGENYRTEMSSPVTAYDACSRLSPHLAWGTLSTRMALHDAKAARTRHGRSRFAQSIDSFIKRLHWRCHFMQKLEDEPAIEHRTMHPLYEGLREPDHDEDHLQAWLKGETGLPMVDASMRALNATGWLNFRMRAMVVSVAAYPLWLDWRRFGPGLARLFTDFEPGIHWSQCQMQSGTTGLNTLRVYNPVKQSKDHDPDGRFLRRWLPELEGVPTKHIHEPWSMPEAVARAAGVRLGRDYPVLVVEPVAAARAARERVYARRRQEGFAEAKQEVIRRHASRKRSPREDPQPTARPRTRTRESENESRQISFDF
ncbi:MAG: FAD-binding domain-containing protein [Pseudomonadota bacterium]